MHFCSCKVLVFGISKFFLGFYNFALNLVYAVFFFAVRNALTVLMLVGIRILFLWVMWYLIVVKVKVVTLFHFYRLCDYNVNWFIGTIIISWLIFNSERGTLFRYFLQNLFYHLYNTKINTTQNSNIDETWLKSFFNLFLLLE